MRYTQYIATIATVSILSISTLALAAVPPSGTAVTSTGGVAAAGTTVTSTGGVTTGNVVVPGMTTTSLEVKGAPRLVKKTADSVVLEWDTVPGAFAYIVKYSKTSVATSKDPAAQYDYETDLINTTGAVITSLSTTKEKLLPGTAYYFSVVATDKDGKESDVFSDELMVMTDSAMVASTGATASTGVTTMVAASALAIKDLVVSDDKTLSLSFNANLSKDPVRVKITKTSDNSDVVVASVVQDTEKPDTVTVTTSTLLSSASSYTLTVLSAKDAEGNAIQEGVSGMKEFTTAETLKSSAPTPDLKSAGSDVSVGSGATATSPETATKVATGAKENIVVFAALLLSLGIVYIYRRKLI
jgi:hypothetical protein